MSPTDARQRVLSIDRVRHLGAYILILAMSVGLVALHMGAYRMVSPIDEFQHLDYLDRAAHLHLVRSGQTVGELAMHEVSCRGMDLTNYMPPPATLPTYQASTRVSV